MRSVHTVTAAYAAAHFAVDFGCAFAYFSACNQGATGFLLYNFCAFALQMPLGLLADWRGRGLAFAVTGGALVSALCLLPSFGLGGCLLLGLGNALFHIGGGVDVMCLSGDRAGPLGVFVSPGAFGLYLGGVLGKGGFPALAACGLVLLCTLLPLRACSAASFPTIDPPELPERSVVGQAALLFLVVLLRSCGGMLGSFPWKIGALVPLSVAAVVLGKTFGGLAADRFGARQVTLVSLGFAALLFALWPEQAAAGLIALLLFNMTMPITLHALAQRMPGCRGFSFGLLTFALFLGFLPVYLGWPSLSGPGLAVVSLLSCGLLLTGLRKREPR